MAEEKKSGEGYSLDFCHWIFDNFDELVDEYKDFGRLLTLKEWRVRQEFKKSLF